MSDSCKTQKRYSQAVCRGLPKGHPGDHNFVEPDGKVFVPKPPPTIDDKLEAIAAKLQDDARIIMLACSESESWLEDMYRRSKESGLSVSPPWR